MMSRAHHVPDAGTVTGDNQYPPQLAPNYPPKGLSNNFVDGSGPIFSMYLEMATDEDKKMAEQWKAGADGILIFTGLFSAAVASLISVSIQDIRPNPQDTSNFYLANIYQTVSDPNRPNVSSSIPASPPPFSPPSYAVWVNALWFLSLVISITCALLATLLQQWARRYLMVAQPRYSPHKRARIRAFFFEGVEKFLLPWAVETLPTLLHVSLFLFFAGLVVLLWNVNLTIFKLVVSWVSICTALYGCITFMPIFRHDCPYHTPLSSLAWTIATGIPYVIFRFLRWFTLSVYVLDEAFDRFRGLEISYRESLVRGMQKTAEKTALNSSSGIDTRAFLWTLDSLDQDHELEGFFSGLPGFRSSKVVDDPLPKLPGEQKQKLLEALIGLLDRTFTSDLLPIPVKNWRATVCAKALDPAEITHEDLLILQKIVSESQYGSVQSSGIVRLVRGWDNRKDEDMTGGISAIVSGVVAKAQQRDDHWFVIASDELGVPEFVLRDYAANGDTLSLAILIHVTRQRFSHFRGLRIPWIGFSNVLEAASEFNVQNTSPELQHDFCSLWNRIVHHAQNHDGWMAFRILGPIRNVYIALHQDTDSAPTRFSASTGNRDVLLRMPASYPVCNVPGHIHDHCASTSFAPTVPHDNAAQAPASLASPDAPSPPIPAPRHVDESFTDVPLLDNDRSFHPAHQTSIEVPTTSQDLVTARVIQDGIEKSTTTNSLSTPPPISMTSTSQPGAVAVRHNADCRNSSDVLDVPSLPCDNILPTGPQLSLDSHITGSDYASSPESHPSLLASVTPDPPRSQLSPAPGIGAAAEGSTKAVLHEERDALEPPSAIRENIMATPYIPPQSSSSVTSVGTPGARYTGDHPPRHSYDQYDIV